MPAPGRKSQRRPTAFVGGKIAAFDRRVLNLGAFTFKGSELYSALIPTSMYTTSGAAVSTVMQREVLRLTIPLLPTITTCTPSSGAINRNIAVTIVGTNFSAPSLTATITNPATGAVVALSSIVVVNDTKITATVAANSLTAVGAATITVSTTNGPATTTFTGTAAAPELTLVDPENGTRPDTINMTGTGFVSGTVFQLQIVGVWTDMDSSQLFDETTASAVVPAVAAGNYAIRAHNANGDGVYVNTFQVT